MLRCVGCVLIVSMWLVACGSGDDGTPAQMQDAGEQPDDGGANEDARPPNEDSGAREDGGEPTPDINCGNRRLESDEECDDGNNRGGDGCSSECQAESGFSCAVAGAACEECGNDIVESSESCDDGNRDVGDGCDDSCALEADWVCPVAGQPCELCGNGVIEANERCDEGSFADGVGCAEDCRSIDASFHCPAEGEACLECGDGAVGGDEVCDDGNATSGDGCVFNCSAVEPSWRCPADGGACTLCGDGSIDGDEECDDGNFSAGDGCDVSCEREPGAICFFPGVLCTKCGNGFIEFIAIDDNGTADPSDDFFDDTDPDAREGCDDGNQTDDDGCSASCELEDGGDLPWLCPIPGVGCGRCGDGIVQAIEACDDGLDDVTDQPAGGDGCSANCTAIEPDYQCPAGGGACALCGDGAIDAALETCDDGDALSGDGCNRLCQLETNMPWVCPEAGEPCELCGNGVTEEHEVCDDGDRDGDDGCSADCQEIEPDYNCFFDGFPCAQCGDGLLSPGEQCDEGQLLVAAQQTAGCDDECQVVEPWLCPVANTSCQLCGDGLIGSAETCEDGNTASGDGCSSLCQVEPGYDCSGGDCLASSCGDGFRAGNEECDDGNHRSGDGCSFVCDVETGWTCAGGTGCHRIQCGNGVVEGDEQCDDADTDPLDGCDDSCRFELGYTCPTPATPCVLADCGDGIVEGSEQCDDGDEDPLDGCDADCQLEADYHCPDPGMDCLPTECGDGLVQGLEQCDDEGTAAGDGCAPDCTVELFHRCSGEPSECRPIVEFVSIRRFTVSSVNPNGLNYDPDRRAFAAHKSSTTSNIPPIELCLDGTVLDPTDGSFTHGAIVAPDGSETALPVSCEDEPTADPCYELPMLAVDGGSLVGSTYDPFTDHVLFLTKQGQTVTLTDVPRDFDPGTQDPDDFDVELEGLDLPADLTVGEDGELYIADATAETVVVYSRRRDTELEIVEPNCAMTPDLDDNCSTFAATPNAAAGWAAPTADVLNALFTVPGENLIGMFNAYQGGASYDGYDLLLNPTMNPLGPKFTTSQYFSFYVPGSDANPPLYGRSQLPGLLFSLGTRGASYSQYGKSAETAADGGSFIMCPSNPSENCQLFARTCETDADCADIVPGTVCNEAAPTPYCHSPGDARDDAFFVERDAGAVVVPLPVLANDSLSESACVDPSMTILSVCGDGVMQQHEMDDPENCPEDTGARGTIDLPDGGTLTYDAPDGECGFVDVFTYTADLGGGFLDIATVRVTVACECGDGVVDANEQCDAGDDNAAPGTLLSGDGTPELDDDVYARCGTRCFFNVFCGDGFIVFPEECDDQNAENGDGCSAFCTLESVCGDGQPEGVEQCDDGDTESGDACNANCTLPVCGDGNVDVQRGEECDDAGTTAGDGCDNLCHIESDCGNGIVEAGEDCDDGGNAPGDGCSAQCTVENVCGNDLSEGGEQCDGTDAGSCPTVASVQIECINAELSAPNICLCENYCGDSLIGGLEECDAGATGSETCRGSSPVDGEPCSLVRCGDGVVDDGEMCDDGNTNPGDGCTNACTEVSVCGNGSVEGSEECDDDNNVSGDGCSSACRDENTVCGDEVLDFDEQCDDGNTMSGDGCDAMCLIEGGVCGNGIVDLGEQCDDENTTPGDGCSTTCQLELCGNDMLNGGEQCDDGNTMSGDGCSAECKFEVE